MLNKTYYLGLDTSNYTTSIAVVDSDFNVIADQRRSLRVKDSGLGLRQSEALFQHNENIPNMLEGIFKIISKDHIRAIGASNKPRPIEGSYMPVFNAGINYGKVISTVLNCPLYLFSHQEGHIEAALSSSSFKESHTFNALHLSGGTSEVLSIDNSGFGYGIKVIGGSKDISFGQLIDRVGVALSYRFPCGEIMDQIATNYRGKNLHLLTSVPVDGLTFNLSGLESQCQRIIASHCDADALIYEVFCIISQSLCQITENSAGNNHSNKILFVGGVSASNFVRKFIMNYFNDKEIIPVFGNPAFSTDNAVGCGILCAKSFIGYKG